MVSERVDSLYRGFRRIYRRLEGSRIDRTPLRSVFSPIKRQLRSLFPTPTAVMLGVTHQCQARCRHCAMASYVENHREELSTEEVFSLLGDIARLGTRSIYFFGGEPLLRRDMPELVRYGHDLGLHTRLDTNGYALSEKMVRDLRQSGLDKIGVSIDDPDPDQHDSLRNLPGSFENAIAAIRRCLEGKLYCYISTYATKENIRNGKLKALIDLARSIQVNHIRILFPVCFGRFFNVPEMRLDPEEKQKLLNMVENPDFVHFEEKTIHNLDDGYCASLGRAFVYISWYGEVQPCPYVPLRFGSIRSEPLITILKRMWRHPIFELARDDCIMNNDSFRDRYLPLIKASSYLPVNMVRHGGAS